MKDNQMKQAELLSCPFCGGEPYIVKDHLGGVIRCGNCQARMVVESRGFGGELDTSGWQARAKLTPSQVSEPSKEVIATIERLLAAEINACNNNGANSISMPDNLVAVARWLHGITLTTTPQEAISPAIAEYKGIELCAKHLENKATEYEKEHGYDDMGGLSFGSDIKMDYYNNLLELAEELRELASKPTGLE